MLRYQFIRQLYWQAWGHLQILSFLCKARFNASELAKLQSDRLTKLEKPAASQRVAPAPSTTTPGMKEGFLFDDDMSKPGYIAER